MALLVSYTEFLLVSAVLFFTYYIWTKRYNTKKKKWPPGPKPYPIIGNLFQLGRRPNISFEKWAKEYGPIVGLRLGTENVVVLSDPSLLKELYSDIRTSGRPENPIFHEMGKGRGFLNSNGPTWSEQRRFAIKTLKELGFSKSSMEGHILEESTSLLNFLQKRTGQVVPGRALFKGAVLNTLWSIVSGERAEWDVPDKPEITLKATAIAEAVNRVCNSGLIFLPFLRFIDPGFFGWTEWVKSIKELSEMMDVSIEKHISTLDPRNPKDFIDHYLIDMAKEENPSSSFYKETGRKNLTQIIFDLFLGGSETTSDSMEYTIMRLSYHTEIQRKLQEEIDAVIGSRQPSLSDRPLMPYTEAILLEMLRLHTIFPISGPHLVLEDMEFHGYNFPKDTVLLFDMVNILLDTEKWGADAYSFRPERFLSETEGKLIRPENFMAFSVGKRQCPGEGLAKDTLFLFVTSIFQKFSVETDPNCPMPDFSPVLGINAKPKPFNIVVKERCPTAMK